MNDLVEVAAGSGVEVVAAAATVVVAVELVVVGKRMASIADAALAVEIVELDGAVREGEYIDIAEVAAPGRPSAVCLVFAVGAVGCKKEGWACRHSYLAAAVPVKHQAWASVWGTPWPNSQADDKRSTGLRDPKTPPSG